MAKRETSLPALGIDGLPPAAALMQIGAAYAINARVAWALAPLLSGMVARALLDRRSVTLATGSATDEVVSLLAAHGLDVPAEIAAGRLLVLTQAAQAATKLANFGAERLIEELEYFCAPRGRLLVIAPADDFLTSGDHRLASRQSQFYANWCNRSRATAVFVFVGTTTETTVKLQALDGWFAGVAHLAGDGLRMSWDVEHWRSPEGAIGSRQYGIGVSQDGTMLVADGRQLSPLDSKIVEAPDYDTVFAVAAAVRGENSRPASWQLVSSHEALLTLASGAVAASFILDGGPGQDIAVLAQTVHHLRTHGGKGIKIIIREREQRLRYNQEVLLGRLGANAVADASLSFSRFLSLIDSLRDRSFDREVPPVFEAAVLAAAPSDERGYLPAPAFTSAVRDAVSRAAQLGVQCALVRLVINPQLPHLDVLRKIRASRPGDLYTADERSVLLFLFACREPDIDTALARIVGPSLAELFDAQLRSAGEDAINTALTALERQLRLTAAVDYSVLLTAVQPLPLAAVAHPASAEAVPTLPSGYPLLDLPLMPARSTSPVTLPVRGGA